MYLRWPSVRKLHFLGGGIAGAVLAMQVVAPGLAGKGVDDAGAIDGWRLIASRDVQLVG